MDRTEEDVEEGKKVGDLLADLSLRYPALAAAAPELRVAVNKKYITDSIVLRDGDEVALLPPISGG